jgi:hypothetical protein
MDAADSVDVVDGMDKVDRQDISDRLDILDRLDMVDISHTGYILCTPVLLRSFRGLILYADVLTSLRLTFTI